MAAAFECPGSRHRHILIPGDCAVHQALNAAPIETGIPTFPQTETKQIINGSHRTQNAIRRLHFYFYFYNQKSQSIKVFIYSRSKEAWPACKNPAISHKKKEQKSSQFHLSLDVNPKGRPRLC